MRALLFFISLFLLVRGDYSAARTADTQSKQPHLHYFALQKQIKTADPYASWTIAEDDLDSVEELYSGDQSKDKIPTKLISAKKTFSEYWLTPALQATIPINYRIQQHFVPFYGYSYPIYITNRVLRI